jgi:pimeloyl-ACP methyl ester carboxylesterase
MSTASTLASVTSADGVRIAYERTGTSPTALVFVHGWLGSARWWDAQREAFAGRYTLGELLIER